MSGVLAALKPGLDDVTPSPFSFAASYSGSVSVSAGPQTIAGINVPIALQVAWSMNGNVNVQVYKNLAVVAETLSASASGSLGFIVEVDDVISIVVTRNANRTGTFAISNVSDGLAPLASFGVVLS